MTARPFRDDVAAQRAAERQDRAQADAAAAGLETLGEHGHFGTGDPEIRIRDRAGLESAGDLLLHSYQAN